MNCLLLEKYIYYNRLNILMKNNSKNLELNNPLQQQDLIKSNYNKIFGMVFMVLGFANIFILRGYEYLPVIGFLLLLFGMMMFSIGLNKLKENLVMRIIKILLIIYIPINIVFLFIVFFIDFETSFRYNFYYYTYFDGSLTGFWKILWDIFSGLNRILLILISVFLIISILISFKGIVFDKKSGYKILGILLILFGIVNFISLMFINTGFLWGILCFIYSFIFFISGLLAFLYHLDKLRRNFLISVLKIILFISFLIGLFALYLVPFNSGIEDGLLGNFLLLIISLAGVLFSIFFMAISGIYHIIKKSLE